MWITVFTHESNRIFWTSFIRPHETLSRGEDRVFRPNTPAMAAGITGDQWTIKNAFDKQNNCQLNEDIAEN
jgi:hypothetical protein